MAPSHPAMRVVRMISSREAPWPRMAVAVACSLALHAALFAVFRVPAPLTSVSEHGLDVLVVPLAPARETPPGGAPRPAPRAEKKLEVAKRSPDAGALEKAKPAQPISPVPPAARERPYSAIVSVGPTTAPKAPLASNLSDAESYLGQDQWSGAPALLGSFSVPYPRAAYLDGRRAVVFAQLMVDERGAVTEALAEPGPDPEFTEAALGALRKLRFQPAQRDGRAVKARLYLVVYFDIE
jgi:TonB family protein